MLAVILFEFIFDIVANSGNKTIIRSVNETKYPNDEKMLVKILENGETVNSQDSQGFTPLIRSARLGDFSTELFSFLKKIVKRTNYITNCVFIGDLDAVRILLRNGANVSLHTHDNDTALHW